VPFLDAGGDLEQRIWSVIRERFSSPEQGCGFAAAGRGRRSGKIRIGYISPRFGDHPIGHVTKSLYGTHDRNRFDVFLYSTSLRNHDRSEYNTFIRGSCDRYTELEGLDVEAATARIREDGVDILVDLNGYMGQTYILEIFSRRAAPVQVYWLGHAGALGLPFYDYVIGDHTVTPREEDEYYTESIVRLPDTFHSYDRHEIAPGKRYRANPGLAEEAFVFCAFNNPVKIDPTALHAWAKILARVPHGLIWLSPGRNPSVETNLKSFIAEQGIAPERLVFARSIGDKRNHFARHQLADLFLDTFTVTASTTALDALWAGLPAVTRPGRHFCSRNCASFLRAVGLEDMICSSTDEYIERAVFMAENPQALAALKARLAHNRDTFPLFDTARFTRNLEAAYQTMWERCSSGLVPSSFDVHDPAA
jgi:predicted O-linked N-acetylglucosamine transferase (SPINDLY family)